MSIHTDLYAESQKLQEIVYKLDDVRRLLEKINLNNDSAQINETLGLACTMIDSISEELY